MALPLKISNSLVPQCVLAFAMQAHAKKWRIELEHTPDISSSRYPNRSRKSSSQSVVLPSIETLALN